MNTQELKDTTIMWYALGFWGVFTAISFIVGGLAPEAFTPIMTGVAVVMLVGLGFYLPTLADNENTRKNPSFMVHQYMKPSYKQDVETTLTPGFVFAYARA